MRAFSAKRKKIWSHKISKSKITRAITVLYSKDERPPKREFFWQGYERRGILDFKDGAVSGFVIFVARYLSSGPERWYVCWIWITINSGPQYRPETCKHFFWSILCNSSLSWLLDFDCMMCVYYFRHILRVKPRDRVFVFLANRRQSFRTYCNNLE